MYVTESMAAIVALLCEYLSIQKIGQKHYNHAARRAALRTSVGDILCRNWLHFSQGSSKPGCLSHANDHATHKKTQLVHVSPLSCTCCSIKVCCRLKIWAGSWVKEGARSLALLMSQAAQSVCQNKDHQERLSQSRCMVKMSQALPRP